MIGNKVDMIRNYRDIKQKDLLEPLNLSSKQAVSNKIRSNSINLKDLIAICDFCDCEIVIQDKKTGKTIVTIDKSDI